MVEIGDTAPEFTAPVATGDVEPMTLSNRLGEEAPIVLAFFPGAFTSVCTTEMRTFEKRLDAFEAHGATVYGVSTDSPFSLNEFRDANDLSFDLISDFDKELVESYGISTDIEDIGVYGIPTRSVFVIDATGTITYSWVSDEPGSEPDYDAIEQAVAHATAAAE